MQIVRKFCPKIGPQKIENLPKHIGKTRKYVVQMACLSVLSPGKWILDIFGKHNFHIFFEFWTSDFVR